MVLCLIPTVIVNTRFTHGDYGKMSARKPGCSLATAIATALRRGPAPISGSSAFIANGVRTVAYTGVALALLQSNTSGAVTLGALQLKSSLGEAFRGTATATLRQGEELQSGCITTSPYKLGTLSLKEPLLIRTPAASQPGSTPSNLLPPSLCMNRCTRCNSASIVRARRR